MSFSLILFALASTLSPGGATALATASGVRFGFLRSIPLLGGIAIGLACLTAAAGAGLATVLVSEPAVQTGAKVLGSAYLAWIALMIARAGAPDLNGKGPEKPFGFLAGVLLLLSNPKGWLMAISAASAFGQLGGGTWGLAGMLGTVFGMSAAFSLTAWCLGGVILARFLHADWHWRVVNIALGAVLVLSIVPIWL